MAATEPRGPTSALLGTDTGDVEYLVTRSGAPVTLYAHGLLGSIAEARTFSSGVPGTAAFLHFRGHGRTRAADGRWDYGALAGELRAVADRVSATRALGVSLGAGAIMRLLESEPERFERVVLMLPPSVDGVRGDAATAVWRTLAGRVEAADAVGVARSLVAGQVPAVRELPAARKHFERVAERLVASDAEVATALRTLPTAVPIDGRAVLRRVDVPVLVVCQRDDPLHSAEVAEELAALFPAGRLHVMREPGLPWFGRDELRTLLTDFLGSVGRAP